MQWRNVWNERFGQLICSHATIHPSACLFLSYDSTKYTILGNNSSVRAMELLQFCVNRLRPRQNGRHFTDDIFKRIFLNENVRILMKLSLKFVPKDPFNNISALFQIMAWCRPGDKPLSEPKMVSLLTYICVTQPQCVKPSMWSFCISVTSGWDNSLLYGVSYSGIIFILHTSLTPSGHKKDESVWKDFLPVVKWVDDAFPASRLLPCTHTAAADIEIWGKVRIGSDHWV